MSGLQLIRLDWADAIWIAEWPMHMAASDENSFGTNIGQEIYLNWQDAIPIAENGQWLSRTRITLTRILDGVEEIN